MLSIRQEQLDVLQEVRLHRWIMKYLTESYGPLPEVTILDMVQSAVRRGRALGLESPFDLRKFAHITFLLGTQFESDPDFQWAREILADPERGTITERVRQLESRFVKSLAE